MDLVNSIDGPSGTAGLRVLTVVENLQLLARKTAKTQKRGTRLPTTYLKHGLFYFKECIVSEHIKCTSRLRDWVHIILKANSAL